MEDLILVTGGAGFIGSNFILQWIASERARIVNLDKLTYAGNLNNLRAVEADARYRFEQGDIVDRDFLRNLLRREQPRAIVHFAAESHVDRSIHGPDDFVRTNVNGTFSLLEKRAPTCSLFWSPIAPLFVPSTSPTTKSSDRSAPTTRPSARPPFTIRTARTPRPRRLPIIWSAPITIHMAFPLLPLTAQIITGPPSLPKSLFRS